MNQLENLKHPTLFRMSVIYCVLQTIIVSIDWLHIADLKQLIIYNSFPVLLLLSINCYVNNNKKYTGTFLGLYFSMGTFLLGSLRDVL